MNKILVLGIVIILIVFMGYQYVYKPTTRSFCCATPPDLTVGWKTYENSEYGLSFKYPPTWNVESGTNYGGGIHEPGYVQFALIDPSRQDLSMVRMVFSVEPTKYKDNQELFIAKANEIAENPNTRLIWFVDEGKFFNAGPAVFIIDQNDSAQKIGCSPTRTHSEGVMIVRNKNLFTFDDYRCDNWDDTVKTVMNSFKFITSPTQANNVKTYQNTAYGFSFKYPAGYEDFKTASLPKPTALLSLRASGKERFTMGSGTQTWQSTYPTIVVSVHPMDKYTFGDAPGGTSSSYNWTQNKCINYETRTPKIANSSVEPTKINDILYACDVGTGDAGFSYRAKAIIDTKNFRIIEVGFASDETSSAPIDENIVFGSFKLN